MKEKYTTALAGRLDIGLLLLIMATTAVAFILLRPHAVIERDLYRFLFVVDITQSMNVTDAGHDHQSTRLAFARKMILESLNELPCGSQAGLAIFAEHRAFLLFSPIEVCANYAELVTMIRKLDWRQAWAFRSEVSKGLYSSLEIASQLGKDTSLVFISDGHEAPPLHAELRPRFQGKANAVRGLIAGVGGKILMPIPKLNKQGEEEGYWQRNEVMQVDGYTQGRVGSSVENEVMTGVDRSDLSQRIAQGTEHLSSLRDGHLSTLAHATGLEYMTIDSVQNFATKLTNRQFAVSKRVETNLSPLLGIMGMILLLSSYCYRPVRQWLRKK